jgi:phosphoribosylamine--glycine ligase
MNNSKNSNSKNLPDKKILVIGSGGREHAVCLAFKKSKYNTEIFALSGNAGIKKIAKIIDDIAISNHHEIINFCQQNHIDFVFVGPEQPLVEGLIDSLTQNNIRCFGPSKLASQLEASKIFMKKIADDNHVPTAKYQTFDNFDEALKFIKTINFPCVIKADGLASGKGVVIVDNIKSATQNITEFFAGKFGIAGKKIIIEEFLTGFEASYFVICDDNHFIPLGFAHDHKKVGEGETGLNTGGMGTFAPSPFISSELEDKIIKTIIEPTLNGMKKNGSPFRGILFAGLMIDNDNPKLLEFNVRFGDPETQVILPLIQSDFVDLIESAIDNNLKNYPIKFYHDKKFVCVVLCSKGYPENYLKNTHIKNLESIENAIENQLEINGEIFENCHILHAGTTEFNNKILASGGRVLNVIAFADNFQTARTKIYKLIDNIDWQEGFCRRDIASSSLKN